MSSAHTNIASVRWTRLILAATLVALAWPPAAAAQTDAAVAQALFDEGRQLMEQRRFEAACDKFAESQRLDPQIGTHLNLANCYEIIGRTASAWAGFVEVATAARRAGQRERLREAERRAARLEPLLMRLRIDVPRPTADMLVEIDGIETRPGSWGTSFPVDPGEHTVKARADGKLSWNHRVTLDTPGSTVEVLVPELEDAPQSQAAPESADNGSDGVLQRGFGVGLGIAGIISIVVGTGLAAVAVDKNDESKTYCQQADPNRCSAEGVTLRDEAIEAQNGAIVSFALGAAAIAGGVVLWIYAPSEDDAAAAAAIKIGLSATKSAAPSAQGTGTQITLSGSW